MASRASNVSFADSMADSVETTGTSLLPALQAKAGSYAAEDLRPLDEEEYDPRSFDIVAPSHEEQAVYSLERRSELLFSKEHMATILADSRLLGQFAHFLATVRPDSVPLLKYYLESEKAMRAIRYANSVMGALGALNGHEFTADVAEDTSNDGLQAKHDAALEALTRDELPMFITHKYIGIVSLSIKQRITGIMPAHLRNASEGLAEVFCLTDPSRQDNPIILASDEFHRTTQYGMDYVIGRNCRFLQGPGTNPFSIQRIRDRLAAGQDHFETFLNYRRDGSPFMNLLVCAPLIDSRGNVRYFLGAQIDVSGLVRECTELEGFRRIADTEEDDVEDSGVERTNGIVDEEAKRDATASCRELSEMFNRHELETVRRYGGGMHQSRDQYDAPSRQDANWNTPYLVLEDGGPSPQQSPLPRATFPDTSNGYPAETPLPGLNTKSNGRLPGIYEHYLLVRPAPSLQILFASPSLRVPGMLQSPFLSRIGGSGRIRQQLAQALGEEQGVTAKVRWLSSTRHDPTGKIDRGRPRWLHCTPLRGVNGSIGIWMIVIIDEEVAANMASNGAPAHPTQQPSHQPSQQHGQIRPGPGRQPKLAPPIENPGSRRPVSFVTEQGGGSV
ncbi:unnamed protein product [Clonostachys solani]|uniref:PAC domain-containing protein n=1 Tax=Clonostachys solani TaxID=160281 RepID=A0A9N9YVH7_9HYPO|nr:unnamed protein product [Clonostachys solani]